MSSASNVSIQRANSTPWEPLSDLERVHAAALGHTLRRLRNRRLTGFRRITQRELGDAAGISSKTIAAIEQGRLRVRPDTLHLIAYALVELRPAIGVQSEIIGELRSMAGPIVVADESAA